MKKFLLPILLLFSSLAFGQGSSPSGAPIAISTTGQPIPGATVAICTTDPGPTPTGVCSSLAATYTDVTLGTACTGSPGTQPLNNRTNPLVGTGCSNPGHADNLGNAVSFTTAGTYYCEYYGPGINGFFAQPCVAGGAVGGGAISGSTAKGNQVVGTGVGFGSQQKPVYDVRDWMTCDGVTNATNGMGTLLNTIGATEATVRVVGTCKVAILAQPPNVTFDFSPGGAISLIQNTTAPGGGAFVQGSGQSNAAASPTSTCSATLPSTTAGNAIVMFVALYNTFGPDNARISSVTDTKNFYIQQVQTTLGFASYQAAYVASSITGGTVTVTANFSHSEKNSCIAWEISGLGPIVSIDNSAVNFGSTTPFSAGPATLAGGDFVTFFGEDPNDAQTCTAGGGYTQPAGVAGNVGTASTNGVAQCAEYIANGTAGATSGTQNFSSSPVLSSWGAVVMGLKPGIATWSALGPVIDPDLHQICIGCTGGVGVMDLTGNLATTSVFPEWFGACNTCSAAVNTPAIQASEYAAFGSGPTAKRINGSGLNIYNKTWFLTGKYQINGEIQFYHVSGNAGSRAAVYCAPGGGLTQTASNLRILDGQSDAYLRFDNCAFTGSSSNTGPLTDFGYSGVQGTDFAPQFIDFYGVTWSGSNITAVGLQGAKEGGGAQFSNIYCYDCAASGFTTAAWQVGTPTKLAQNALAIGWYGGDMQGNPKYGFAGYGVGFVFFFGTSFEDNYALQTGADVLTGFNLGPTVLYGVRSESRVLCLCDTLDIEQSEIIDQDQFVAAGASDPVGTYMTGSSVGGDGAHYKVTVDGGPFGGFGSQSPSLIYQASGGSTSTLVDTNQSLTGTVTVLTPNVNGETVTQAVTGSTATMLVNPAVPSSLATITGTATSGQMSFNEIIKQSVTNVTATEQAPSPTTGTTQSLFANNFSGTADCTDTWVGQTSGAVYTPSACPSFAATTMYITAATGSPDATHNWTGGTSGFVFTPTQAPQSVNWTVNSFAGMIVSIFAGTNGLCYAPISSNTANTITISGSWLTRYPPTFIAGPTQVGGFPCSAADSTSTFIVEPGWNHGTVTSGGMTLAYANENVVGGGSSPGVVFAGKIVDTWLHSGGQVAASTNGDSGVVLSNVVVSRQDWLPSAAGSFGATHRDWDVRVSSPINRQRNAQLWQYSTLGGGLSFLGAMHRDFGTTAFCWNTVSLANVSANEVCVGGRSDPAAGTSPTRSIFEVFNPIGPPSPYQQVNANGGELDLQGGLPSGSGTPGQICFWAGSAGASGTTINNATKQWCINSSGNLVAQGAQTVSASGFNTIPSSNFGQLSTYTSSVCETSGAPTTLNTGSTTTTTGQSCLPATAIIDAVVYRITTTITTAASFTIGDGTVATRFCGTQSTLTAGTTGTCFAQADQTGTSGPRQVSAAGVVITTNANPGAGAIRLFVFYHTWTPPTS